MRKYFISVAKAVIDERRDSALEMGLTNDFVNGFEEGIAEFLGMVLDESATDLMEEISPY